MLWYRRAAEQGDSEAALAEVAEIKRRGAPPRIKADNFRPFKDPDAGKQPKPELTFIQTFVLLFYSVCYAAADGIAAWFAKKAMSRMVDYGAIAADDEN